MIRNCPANWGSLERGWSFCVLPKGHEGAHKDYRGMPPDAPMWDAQPEAQAHLEREQERERNALSTTGG